MRLRDIKISVKLNGSFVIATIFVLMLGLIGSSGASSILDAVKDLAGIRLPSIEAMTSLYQDQITISLAERTILLSEDPQERAYQKGRMEKVWSKVDEVWKRYDASPRDPEEEALWKQFQQSWADWKEDHDRVIQLAFRGDPAARKQAIALSMGDVRRHYLASNGLSEQIIQRSQKYVEKSAENAAATATRTRNLSLFGMLLGAILSQFFGIFLTRSIIKPLKKGVALAEAIQKGDLTRQIDVDQKDEIGQLASALNEMSKGLIVVVRALVGDSSSLNAVMSDLSAVSEQLLGNSTGMSEKSSMVAAATEEMSASMISVSAAAEQATANANVVATATEEMTSTVGEIAHSADKARVVTSEAVASVDSASQQMNELGEAAKAISKVIEVIVEIAEQTKLLALNATIEAARAGEAGKGFAVVANEVKELAKQTNAATEEIRQKIEAMQSTTDKSISEIDGINRIIHTVEEIIASIATAVEEQSITTREIASNIGQAAVGISSVTKSVAQTAGVARDVAADVGQVNAASGEIRTASHQLTDSAHGLAKTGASLAKIIEAFKV